MSSAKKRPIDIDETSPTTPQKRKQTALAPHHVNHTPFNLKSNQHSPLTQDLTTNQILQKQHNQHQLLLLLKEEPKGATYEADWVAEHFCPAPVETVDKVMDSLRKAKIWRPSVAKNFSVRSMRSWPKKDSGELRYYGPFVALLNAITAAFKECFPAEYQSSLFQSVTFYKYAKTMMESVTGEFVLKPDILALISGLTKGRASWYATLLAGEVKSDWGRLLLQAGTYVRCLFAATDHRAFIPILALHHTTSEFRLCFYHRSGVLATHSMNLKTESGLRDLVSTIVGMWRWQTPSQAGYEPTQVPKYFSFNETRYYIHHVVCRRQAIRGRATCVYIVKRTEVPDNETRYLAEPRAECGALEWKCLNPFDLGDSSKDPDDIEDPIPTQKLPIQLPDSFTVKCSHQIHTRDNEVDVFSGVQGYIGIPDIITAYEAVGFIIPLGKTVTPWKPSCLKDDAPVADDDDDEEEAEIDNEDPEAFGDEIADDEGEPAVYDENEPTLYDDDDSPSLPYEARIHRHLLIKSIGVRFTQDLTFRAVGVAMLHAMIGHCALFTEGGYLHRDISNGNILMLSEPLQSRKIPSILDGIVTDNTCTGILIDGDVAKKWGTPASASDRSGTLPFMSARVLYLWVDDFDINHTPIDDLESFGWVLLYNALAWTPAKSRNSSEVRWWNNLNKEDVVLLYEYKSNALLSDWAPRAHAGRKMTGIVENFRSLIYNWFVTTQKYAQLVETYETEKRKPAEYTELFKNAYRELVRLVVIECEKLPDVPIKSVVFKKTK
ncbi:hypothetical protein HGRIS_014225 [Hohenbuehelia grisea]|uniref:Fungal-type protein kinase domain-containing protein n=1 Tax=Hohenbuehelia grisea TaxID=104357 RepID=A0ABR3JUW5_9AGAR